MDEAIKIIEKLDWFIKPVYNAIIWLFTNPTGKIILITAVSIYFLATLFNAYRVRRLVQKGSTRYGTGRLTLLEQLYIFFRVLGTTLLNIIYKAPVLLGVLLFFLFVGAVSQEIKMVDKFRENQQRVEQLTTVVKHLDQRYKVADMLVTDQTYDPLKMETTTTLKLKFYDYANTGLKADSQTVTIKGNEIYFDAVVMNFEYSEIASGGVKNLTIPDKLFSNAVSKENGIDLKVSDENGIPFMYHRSKEDIYGISPDTFNIRLQEIIDYLHNEEAARKAGIRTITGNAVHVRVRRGYRETIWVEQTGGLVIKPTETF